MSNHGSRPSAVFFGSGPVAAESLALLLDWCDIEAVITKPQPIHHKEPFPVLALCAQRNLKTFTRYGKKELSELFTTKPADSSIGIVIDYGFIINQDVIDYFPLGIINSHFSLLPEWRGADPISFAILSGQERTGVSLMRIVAAMDEGPVIAQGIQDIADTDTTPSLTDKLIRLSDGLLHSALPQYIAGDIPAISQEDACRALDRPFEPSYSRKLSKQDGMLDFTKSATQLEREVRAFIEWPKSRTELAGKEVVITEAHALDIPPSDNTQVGQAITNADKMIGITCGQGMLVVDKLKPAGKPEMTAQAFLAGNKL